VSPADPDAYPPPAVDGRRYPPLEDEDAVGPLHTEPDEVEIAGRRYPPLSASALVPPPGNAVHSANANAAQKNAARDRISASAGPQLDFLRQLLR
jgi:hypothetical protein